MRLGILSAALLLTATPTMAQNLDNLRSGLEHLPATVLAQQTGDLAYFVDIEALAAVAEDLPNGQPLLRLAPGPISQINAELLNAESEWWAKSGTSLDQVRYFTGYGQPPNINTQWGLSDDAAASDMLAELETLGFESAGGGGLIGNGEAMRFDPTKVDRTDPWRTQVGAAQFAAVKGSNVVQAASPQQAMLAAAEQPALSDEAIFQAALQGLEQNLGDKGIVQAMVISPLFGATGLDPALLLSPSSSMDEVRQNIEAQMAGLEEGIPFYLGGIIADVQGDSAGVAIALTYPDCAIAETAADMIAVRWAEMAPEGAQGEIATTTAEGKEFCSANVTVMGESGEQGLNLAYNYLLTDYFGRRVGVLQIGAN